VSFFVDIFGNDAGDPSGAGEGQVFLMTADVTDRGLFSASTMRPAGSAITAIVRSGSGDTSQFYKYATISGP
jgi:hypothetical protein